MSNIRCKIIHAPHHELEVLVNNWLLSTNPLVVHHIDTASNPQSGNEPENMMITIIYTNGGN